MTKLQSGDVALSTTVVQAPDGLLTPAQNATLSGLAGTTVTDLDGGAVSTTNAAPTIASAETTTIDASGAAAALTATAVVTDAEGNYNGGSITISFANAFVEDAGITLAAGDFSFSGTSIIADSNAVEGDDDVIIGSITYNGATDLDTSGGTDTAYESVTINFDSDLVTNDVVTALIADIRIEDPEVEGGAGAVTTDAIVTVTVADASGDSASFSRLVDPSGALALADLDDDGGEIEIEDAAAATIDGGGNAAIDLNGSETVGMTIAFSSTVAGDTFAIENVTGAGLAGQARVIGSNLAYGANDTIIGTVSGNGEASLVITLGTLGGAAEVSNEAIIDDILQGVTATYDTGTAGARDVTTTVTSGNSWGEQVTNSSTMTIIENFLDAEVNGADAGVGADAAGPLTWSAINTAINANQVVELKGNTYIEMDVASPTTDFTQAVADNLLVVPTGTIVRLQSDTGKTNDLSGVTGLNELGTVLFGTSDEPLEEDLTVTAAQANGNSGVIDTNTFVVQDVDASMGADLSNISAVNNGVLTATATLAADAEFVGDLGGFDFEVSGAYTLTVSADRADAKTITGQTNNAAADILITGVDASFEGDLGGVTTAQANDGVIVNFASSMELHANAQIASADLAATVAADATLTLSASQATAIAAAGGAITGAVASGALGSVGGSMVVTVSDMDSNGSTDAVELEGLDLSALTAGGVNAGGYNGTSVMVIDQDVEMTGTLTVGTTTISVASGATITDNGGAAATLTGATMTGAGNIVIADIGADANADLSTLTNTGTQTANVGTDATFTGDFGTFDVVVAENITLTADVEVVSGLTVAGAATTVDAGADTGGSIALTGLDADAFDLSNITGGAASEAGDTAGTVTVTGDIDGDVVLHADTDLGNAAVALDDATGGTESLTLTAAQATGRVITDDANESLVITGLAGDTDLSGITLSGSGGITINMADGGAADVSGNANFLAADAGDTALAIALTDSTLTATAEQLDGATVTGADGSDGDSDNDSVVVLTGGVAAATGGNTAYDITGLNDTSVDLTIAADYTVSNFTEADGTTVRTATLTADAVHLAGQSVSGTGVVVGAAFDATAAGDYSGLTATTTQLQLTADATLSSSVTVGTATIVLDSDAAGAGSSDDSLNLTMSQVTGLNVADGGGNGTSNVTVTGTVTADVVDYSSIDWDVDTLTVNMLSGDNNITGAQSVGSNIITTSTGNDTIITGTNADVITGGLGNDLFEINHGDATNAVTIMDFVSGSDYIDLDTAVGFFGLAADADLATGGDAATVMAAAVTVAETAISGAGIVGNYFFAGDTDANDGGAAVKGFLMVDTVGDDAIDLVIILDGLGAADIQVTDII
ncbi:hypothetical protein N9792_07070 [Planktomarina temperata]|nr:hypothetical protein [Planktomarina temperata]